MNSYNKFWIQKSKILNWVEKPKVTLKRQKKNYFKIFPNAKINAYENIIGKNLKKTPNKTSIICINSNKEIRKYSYKDIDKMVNKL